jgi:Polyketide cyclase / dehydrase and lipid transport
MRMRMGVPYYMRSRVVEFEPNRQIAWTHFVGHRWRWEVEPAGEGKSRVTETFDMSTAHFPPALRAMGYPKAHARNVGASVANVVSHFTGGAGAG